MSRDPGTNPQVPGHSSARAGFTMVELAMVMGIALLLFSISVPRVSKMVNHSRVNNAVAVVSADLQQGFELAVRTRAPIRMTYTSSTKSYSLANRTTGATLRSRIIGPTSEYKLTTITFSPATVDMFPSGISSGTLTVTLGVGGYSRIITATTAGLVRRSQ